VYFEYIGTTLTENLDLFLM